MKKTFIFAAAVAVILTAETSTREGQAWWSHVQKLASDEFDGRKPGTDGYDKAAKYVAEQFAAAGLKPAGTRDFFQPVQFKRRQILEDKSELTLINGGKEERLVFGKHAYLSPRENLNKVVEAEAIFVGHGLQIPEMKIDDFRGIDLKGKIAVYLSAAPRHVPGPLAAHAQSAAVRWRALKAAGAIGTASWRDPATNDIPWERAAQTRTLPSLSLADPSMNEAAGSQVAITVNSEHADKFLAGSGHTGAELLKLHRAGRSLPKFPLPSRIRVLTAATESTVSSDNVAGLLRGSDPKLADEYVVLTAHLDHLGSNSEKKGDATYNGAMDNATGIATLIEVARSMAKSPPKRSVLFVAVTGEESGLLGSKYFARKPTVDSSKMIANLNFDMFLPIVPLTGLVVYGMDESDLGDDAQALAKEFRVRADRDPEPERNLFIRSDQYSFIRQGIPALAFKFSPQPNTDETKLMKSWLTERYHGLTDDVGQPVRVEDAVKFNELMTSFVRRVANREQRPRWKPSSFFRRYSRS